MNKNYKYDIFIAYNTDSIVDLVQKKYEKTFKYDSIICDSVQFCENNTISEFKISKETEEKRKKSFMCINKYYEENRGKFSLYFDILTDEYEKPELTYHVETNKKIIKNSKILVFVVSNKEISFWQLQESFFASYYNKKVVYLTSSNFLRLIKRKRFDNYINSELKSK